MKTHFLKFLLYILNILPKKLSQFTEIVDPIVALQSNECIVLFNLIDKEYSLLKLVCL